MKVIIRTLGCKVNQYESQVMLEQLESAGFTDALPGDKVDLVVINSCTVTASGDQKMRQMLRRERREHPEAVLVLTGCMPQAFPELAEQYEEADIVLGNQSRMQLLPAVLSYMQNRRRIVSVPAHETGEAFEKMSVSRFHERTRAFLKIEDGCNRFCSYCIIPYARGRVRSKPLEEIEREAATLAAAGYRELVLVGINLSAYGQGMGLDLCDAVEAACAQEGISRVRLGSLEPERMDKVTVERLSRQENLCPQFHLSLQSGCNATLSRMNRHYTAEEYLEIVARLRGNFSNSAITTDIMVGFPGETEEEFFESLAFARRVGFAKTHVFAYSPRPGTLAAARKDQIPASVKEERSKEMIRETEEIRRAFLETQLGREEPVLFETTCRNGRYTGYTPNYTPVQTTSSESLCGTLRKVRLIAAEKESCIGELI